jgi:hypothetical protein
MKTIISIIIVVVSASFASANAEGKELVLNSYGMEYSECIRFVKGIESVLGGRYNISRDGSGAEETYTIGVIMDDGVEGNEVENFVLTCSKIDGKISFGKSEME